MGWHHAVSEDGRMVGMTHGGEIVFEKGESLQEYGVCYPSPISDVNGCNKWSVGTKTIDFF